MLWYNRVGLRLAAGQNCFLRFWLELLDWLLRFLNLASFIILFLIFHVGSVLVLAGCRLSLGLILGDLRAHYLCGLDFFLCHGLARIFTALRAFDFFLLARAIQLQLLIHVVCETLALTVHDQLGTRFLSGRLVTVVLFLRDKLLGKIDTQVGVFGP